MLSNKPYLIRAFYDWIVDSRCTPILVVNAAIINVDFACAGFQENARR